MKLLVPIALLLLSMTTAAGAEEAIPNPQVVFIAVPEKTPAADEVMAIFEKHLLEVDIAVDTVFLPVKKAPRGPAGWMRQAATTSDRVGIVAVFGYQCGPRRCHLYVMDPKRMTYLKLPIQLPESGDVSTAFAVAATAREALLGPLYPEMKRLAGEGAAPMPPRSAPSRVWLKSPYETSPRPRMPSPRPWLWLEGGYVGDYPHPDGFPLHGPWLGIGLEPAELLGIHLSLAWLGIRKAEVGEASARVHRLVSALSVPLVLRVGTARISLAPVVRLDAAFATIDNVGDDPQSRTMFELQAGGLTVWHLPLTRGVEILIGAGILVSVMSEAVEIALTENRRETAIPPSTLRLTWLMGLSWSPLANDETNKGQH